MITKLVEIRDRGTFIAAVAIRCDPSNAHEHFLLARTGYGVDAAYQRQYILLGKINGGECSMECDPHKWRNGRTMREAHLWLEKNFDSLQDGQVIDVEYILGETNKAKVSEMEEMILV